MITDKSVLKNFTQFTDVNLQQEILSVGKLHKFKAGDLVIDEGMPVPFVPLITEGSLRILRRDKDMNEILLYYINAGQTCATSLTCCMNHAQSEVEAVAEEDVTLIGIPAKTADSWFTKYDNWKNFAMLSYKYRFNELLETINSIAFTQLDKRLIKYLREKSRVHKSQTLHVSHLEIATDLNSSREVISRLLKQLERNNQVKLARNEIELLF